MTPSLVRLYSAGPAPLTPQIVEERVLNILKDFDKVDAAKLNLDAHFINDLGLDSLDQVEITMALEDEFNIEIPDRDAEEIMTARQAADKVCYVYYCAS
ncbi:acyl carrier protein-like protein [Gaertneriomyces semiglobifer]|nr:acyl carrier protein-like protein [Gaertneriomyces semiglobifer]KAI9002439.1 acyl carrier protein-like protein [Gaertneriomyces semiglobifer]